MFGGHVGILLSRLPKQLFDFLRIPGLVCFLVAFSLTKQGGDFLAV
jgi:hypothetical protein